MCSLVTIGLLTLHLFMVSNPEKTLEIESVKFHFEEGVVTEIFLKNKFSYQGEEISRIFLRKGKICSKLLEIEKFPQRNTAYFIFLSRFPKLKKEEDRHFLQEEPVIDDKPNSFQSSHDC
ncbi:hypothetical protein ACFL3M_00185 [Patescibacteria group bacterium]